MKRFSFYIVLISLFLLSACNQNNEQPLQGQSSDEESLIIPQSDSDNVTKENTIDPSNEKEVEEVEVIRPPGYGVPQIEPSKQSDYEEQSGPKINQISEGNTFKLPFADFKERWNAIASEQASNLKLSLLEKVESENEDSYRTSINENLQLRIYVNENMVQRMQIENTANTNSALFEMLTAWSHIVYMLNPDAQSHHVDDLFHELGVRPNLDFHSVTEKTVEQEGIQYTVIPVKTGYQFEAKYLID